MNLNAHMQKHGIYDVRDALVAKNIAARRGYKKGSNRPLATSKVTITPSCVI